MKKICLDIGSAFVRGAVLDDEKNFFEEPSVLAVDKQGEVKAIGDAAKNLDTASPGTLRLVKLFSENKNELNEKYIGAFIKHILKKYKAKRAELYLSLPNGYGLKAEELFVSAARRAGARSVVAVSSLYAALVGCDVRSGGNPLIVNIGSDILTMTAYAGENELATDSRELGGSAFSRAIIGHVREKHHVVLSLDEADRIKMSMGTLVTSGSKSAELSVIRKPLGLPKKITVTEEELSFAMEPVFDELADAVMALIRRLPCEPDKIVLVGGGANLNGLAPALAPIVCLKAEVSAKPELAVARGLAAIAEKD